MEGWREKLVGAGRSGPAPLAVLRARVAQVAAECDRKHAAVRSTEARPGLRTALPRREETLSGEEVETAFGRHFETETLYAAERRHGSADIGALSHLPHDLLGTLSGGAIAASPPEEWAFLDTETTGLGGGSGSCSCAFLVGVGRITREGFRVRQFLMRDHGEEASLLDALARHLKPFGVLITYNGRAFDQPLLEARYRWKQAGAPFAHMRHLDLLHGARRLWKLRFESCRLVDLESQVLGVEREGDIPGALIPYVYFEYLRTGQAARLLPVFEHNAIDILTLACLTGIVAAAFVEASQDPASGKLRHGGEMTGVAGWLREAGDLRGARTLLRRALYTPADAPLPDDLLFRAQWDLAQLERQLDARDAALEIWQDLASGCSAFRVRAIEELAKHYEHRVKDRQKALEWTRAARALEDSPDLARREERLSRTARKKPAQGRLGPPNRQELVRVPPSQAPLCGRVPEKPAQGRLGPPNRQELPILPPSRSPLCGRVPEKPAQGRLGPPNRQELPILPPSRSPLCGRVPEKPAQGRLGPPNRQELPILPPSQAPLCGRVPEKLAQGRLGPPNRQELPILPPSQVPLCGRVPQKTRRLSTARASAVL